MISLAIVTPWLDHLELADDYFEAVLPEMEEGDVSIVVDDASSPPLKFGTVCSKTRLGFCGACNLGLGMALTDAVLFLNNDVVLGERGWLERIREALEPGVLVGPLRDGPHAAIDGTRFPYIDGWCIAGMRSDLLALGGFDTKLQEPAYYSDNLLCLEARARGMRLRDVRVPLRHKENVTAGPGNDPRVQAASSANRAQYVARAKSVLQAA